MRGICTAKMPLLHVCACTSYMLRTRLRAYQLIRFVIDVMLAPAGDANYSSDDCSATPFGDNYESVGIAEASDPTSVDVQCTAVALESSNCTQIPYPAPPHNNIPFDCGKHPPFRTRLWDSELP